MPSRAGFSKAVFINCPFDQKYKPIFTALVFAVSDLGFVARCAREADDSGEVRIAKIERIIEGCKYGIHDISEVSPDPVNHLPRFNMPLELGMFMGCKRFGPESQKKKISLVLDKEPYRYQKFISDIAGQDIRAHGDKPEQAIGAVRDWLATASKSKLLPGREAVADRYHRFMAELPRLCEEPKLNDKDLTFSDLSGVIADWLEANR